MVTNDLIGINSIDEAHHAPAPTYRRILEYCRAWRADGPLVVGVTATPERGDRQSLRDVFDRIVYQKTLLEMMQAGYLVDLRALQVLLYSLMQLLTRLSHRKYVQEKRPAMPLASSVQAGEVGVALPEPPCVAGMRSPPWLVRHGESRWRRRVEPARCRRRRAPAATQSPDQFPGLRR